MTASFSPYSVFADTFQSSPDLVVGRYGTSRWTARAQSRFQSSPDLVVGRYGHEPIRVRHVGVFQSSPDLVVGRYGTSYKA